MENTIQTVKKQVNENNELIGYLVDGIKSVPLADGNRDYKDVQEYIINGGIVEPAYTEEELAKQELDKQTAEDDARRKQAMLGGLEYNGYIVSLTKDDGDGLAQVKNGFDLGLTNTIIHFENGTKMPITADEFQEFALWFVNERNKFFGGN